MWNHIYVEPAQPTCNKLKLLLSDTNIHIVHCLINLRHFRAARHIFTHCTEHTHSSRRMAGGRSGNRDSSLLAECLGSLNASVTVLVQVLAR